MIKKGILLIVASVLITVIGVSCGPTKSAVAVSEPVSVHEDEPAPAPVEQKEEQPQMLLVIGTLSYDSVKAVYNIKVDSQTQFDGTLNTEDAAAKVTDKDLNYVQLTNDSTVLSAHGLKNPLVQEMEYSEGNVIKHETVRLKEAVFFWRLQLNPLADKVMIRNGEKEIITLDIVRK